MATDAIGGETPTLFLRKATGLVRGWSVRDSIIYACLATNFVTLGIYEFTFAGPAFPSNTYLYLPTGSVGLAPTDHVAVIDAINKLPFEFPTGPPYTGAQNPPVEPGPKGHFDHLNPDSRAFACATMYATVRRTLDIWEDYFGHPIPWFFETDFERLELIPLIEWDNAHSGYGFLSSAMAAQRKERSITHGPSAKTSTFLRASSATTFSIRRQECRRTRTTTDRLWRLPGIGADLTAIVASMHFNSVVDHLLKQTRGNLFTVNELDRVGELSDSREIRVAFNSTRLGDVGNEPHDRSLPLTGGIFDIMVEVFQKKLVAQKPDHPGSGNPLDARTGRFTEYRADSKRIRHPISKPRAGFQTTPAGGARLPRSPARANLGKPRPEFPDVRQGRTPAPAIDRDLGGENQETIRGCFAWREISSTAAALQFTRRTLDPSLHGSSPSRGSDQETSPNSGRRVRGRPATPVDQTTQNGHEPGNAALATTNDFQRPPASKQDPSSWRAHVTMRAP